MKKTKIKRTMSAFLSVLMGAMMMPIAESTAATVYTENITSSQDGYDFELWKDYGNTSMELTGSNGGFKCSWDNIGNALFRTGKKWSGTYPQWQTLNGIEMEYEADYRPNGNSYLSVYGWTKAPLVEYYIIESWGTWRPPGSEGTYKGSIEVDGATYDVYETLRVNKPSIEGDTTFPQYFSVRREGDKSTSGTVSVSEHFEAWEEQFGLEMGGMYEVSLVVEGYQSSGSATVSKNILTFGGGDKVNTTQAPTQAPSQTPPNADGYYFHSTFESGMDDWSARGENSVAASSTAHAAGSKSLYISDRTESWNGAGMTLGTSTFLPGKSYSFSTMVMQNEAASEDFKLSLQYDDASGETQYATVAEGTGAKGKWTQLANTSYTIPAGASNMLLYVETAEGLTSFYMDEAIAAPDGTKIAASTGSSTDNNTDPTEPNTPSTPAGNNYYFHSNYENGTSDWTARGENSIASNNTAAFAGSKSLYVSDRTESWNGAGYTLNTNTFRPGSAYSFSTMVMQNEIASEEFKLSLQYDDASGETQYATVAQASAAKGQWVKLANPNFTIPSDASNMLLYVETAEGLTSFYMDEAIGAPKGTVVSASGKAGDVNEDGSVSVLDVVALQRWMLGGKVTISAGAADLDCNGRVNAFDLAMLKRLVMNPPEEYVAPTEPPTQKPTQTPTTPPAAVPGQWYNTADISWIDTSKPMVAISFDDGPVGVNSTDTSIRIQNALADNGFHATFFYWGNRIKSSNEAEITRAHELGFEIANHTMTHPYLTNLSASGVQEEINGCKSILTRLTGQSNFLIRPPYLSVNATVQSNAGAPLITCAVDSADWNNASTQQIIDKIVSGMNNGTLDNSVVLMHETYTTTAEAMEYLAPYMKEQGWQIVTVSEMFKANGKEMKDGQVYSRVN